MPTTEPGSAREVLIVDDGAFFASLLAEALGQEGFRVTQAQSISGLSRVLEGGLVPALVVMKLDLPDHPGDLACKQLRSTPGLEKVAVLLYGEEGTADGTRKAEAAGAAGYLRMPFAPVRILEWAHAHPELFMKPETLPPLREHVLPPREVTLEALTSPGRTPQADGPPRVLVVDDDAVLLDSLQAVLEAAGYDVFTAVDWASFRDHLMARPFSLILLDVALPGINGEKLALFAHAFLEPPRPRILLHSGLPPEQLEELTLSAKADGYVCKGPSARELLERVAGEIGLPED